MILTLGTTPALARSMIFDRVTLDAVNRAKSVRVSAAGKSVNVARVLRTLGENTCCTGFVGGDAGRSLRRDLDALQIAHDFVETTCETRTCVTVIDRGSNEATELVEEAGPATEPEVAALLERLRMLAKDCRMLICAGTLAPGVPVTFYRDCLLALRAVRPDARVIVDARGKALHHAAAVGAIVKCNRTELGDCLGATVDDEDQFRAAIDAVIALGAPAAVISDGLRPTHVADRHGHWTIDTPKVEVVSPIGSGDSMAAGLAAGLSRGLGLADAAILGVACAAANVQTPIAGQVELPEVERLRSTFVRIEANRAAPDAIPPARAH